MIKFASTLTAVLLSLGLIGVAGAKLAEPAKGRVEETTDRPVPVDEQPSEPAPPMAAEELGKRLFFDRNLSIDRTVSCADCHKPEKSYTSGGRATGLLGRSLKLRAPTLLNRKDGTAFMWDGRAKSLEEQVLLPITNPDEMGLTVPELEKRTGMPADKVVSALAAYERTLTHKRTIFDDYLDGKNANIEPAVMRGWAVFRGKGKCNACHIPPLLTDDKLHDTTGSGQKFKTPQLRGVIHAAPYMHDGSVRYLINVIQRYNAGGGEAEKLSLTDDEMDDLYELLRAL